MKPPLADGSPGTPRQITLICKTGRNAGQSFAKLSRRQARRSAKSNLHSYKNSPRPEFMNRRLIKFKSPSTNSIRRFFLRGGKKPHSPTRNNFLFRACLKFSTTCQISRCRETTTIFTESIHSWSTSSVDFSELAHWKKHFQPLWKKKILKLLTRREITIFPASFFSYYKQLKAFWRQLGHEIF